MYRRIVPAAFLPLLLLATGCTSDGQVGEQGVVRFSQVLHFADTDDFTAPVAVGRTVLVAIQETEDSRPGDEDTVADVTFEVRDAGGAPVSSVYPLGFGQYGMVLESAGTYEMVVLRDGEPIDGLTIEAREQAGIRFSERYLLATDGDNCDQAMNMEDGLDGLIFYGNQELTVYVVPEAADGTPLLGLLPLTAVGPDTLEYDSPLVGQGRMANALRMRPRPGSVLGDPIDLQIRDEDTGHALDLTFETRAADSWLDCPSP